MGNINEYDECQFRLMYENLMHFEENKIRLSSLISSLEFLFSVLELIDDKWEEKFLKEVAVLESINAIEVMADSGEEAPEIDNEKKMHLIHTSVLNLKTILMEKLSAPS